LSGKFHGRYAPNLTGPMTVETDLRFAVMTRHPSVESPA